jgi:Tfp pilus assembly protein PilO
MGINKKIIDRLNKQIPADSELNQMIKKIFEFEGNSSSTAHYKETYSRIIDDYTSEDNDDEDR